MKKIIWGMISLLALILSGCGNNEVDQTTIANADLPQYEVYFDIDFDGNLFLNKYDVKVNFGGQEIGTIKHGEYFTQSILNVTEGKYNIVFENLENSNVQGRELLTVDKDKTFVIKIKAESNNIEVEIIEEIDGVEASKMIMPDLVGVQLDKAILELKEIGFTNIAYAAEGSQSIWNETNWVVTEQNITAKTENDKNTEIILTAIKQDSYINNQFTNLPLDKGLKEAADLGYSKVTYYSVTNNEINDNEIENTDLENWIIQSAKQIDSDEKILSLTVAYTGEVEMPDLIGKNGKEASEILSKAKIYQVETKYTDQMFLRNAEDYEVIEQSIKAKEKVSADSVITLTLSEITTDSHTGNSGFEIENTYDFSEKSETTTEPVKREILTYENNAELAYILDNDDVQKKEEFVNKYKGQLIEFDANIAYYNLHGSYTTRYDFLIYCWDYSETTARGASFQIRDKNYYDMTKNWVNAPDSIEAGTNIRIIAEIEEYTKGELIIIDPISIKTR